MKTIIEPTKSIGNISVSNKDDVYEYSLTDKKVIISKEVRRAYQEAMNPNVPVRLRLRSFLLAENSAGRIFSRIKDFIFLFAPKWMKVGYDSVDQFIIEQIGGNKVSKDVKVKVKSKTIITFGVLFVVGILMSFGIIPDDLIDLNPDAEWVMVAVGIVGILLRLITNKPVKLGHITRKILRQK